MPKDAERSAGRALRVRAAYRIDPFDLALFMAVVEAGTITAGARLLHLSLAAASERLQQLEHATGVQLLRRSRQGVTATEAGHVLLRHAGRLQRDLEAMHAEMAAHARGLRGTVRVLCNTSAMTEHLPPLIGGFLRRHRDVDIDLREMQSLEVLQAMRLQRCDLGVVSDYVDTTGLRTSPFRDDPLVAVLPSRGRPGAPVPAAGGASASAPIAFAALVGRAFVGLSDDSGFSGFLRSQALRHGCVLQHRVRVRGFDAVIALVADGVGVAVVPRIAALRLLRPGLVVRPLSDAWARRRLLLCMPGDGEPSAPAADLYAFLAANC